MNRILNPFDEGIGVELACPIPWCRARINQYCVDRDGEELARGHWARRVPMRIGRRFLAWVRRRRSRNVVAYTAETTWGATPANVIGAPLSPDVWATPPAIWGDATFDCPKCGAAIRTAGNCMARRYVFGFGAASVVMTGVLCEQCRSSYTVELTEKLPNDPDEAGFRTAGTMTVDPEPNPPAPRHRAWIQYGSDDSPDLDPPAERQGAEPE